MGISPHHQEKIDPANRKQIKEKIQNDLNPGLGLKKGLKHNAGKPKPAPYATENTRSAATFLTNCAEENRASLQCIERNYQNRAACNIFFEAYKSCRREENEQRKEANAKASQDAKSAWFW